VKKGKEMKRELRGKREAPSRRKASVSEQECMTNGKLKSQ
jgi:hypothetical protein